MDNVHYSGDIRALSRLRPVWCYSWCVKAPGSRKMIFKNLLGSLAAAFQAWAYGAFTPAGGIFATLTSLGMLGFLAPPVALSGAGVATAASCIVALC